MTYNVNRIHKYLYSINLPHISTHGNLGKLQNFSRAIFLGFSRDLFDISEPQPKCTFLNYSLGILQTYLLKKYIEKVY